MTKYNPAMIARMRALAAAGCTVTQVAAQLGVHKVTVMNWARQFGIALPSQAEARRRAWANPVTHARLSAAIGRGVRARHRQRALTRVPDWVHSAGLAGLYVELLRHGETIAIAACRRIVGDGETSQRGGA